MAMRRHAADVTRHMRKDLVRNDESEGVCYIDP